MQNTISLKPIKTDDTGSPVKSVALATFRLLRKAASQAQQLPVLVHQTGLDIKHAWQESAQPVPKQ